MAITATQEDMIELDNFTCTDQGDLERTSSSQSINLPAFSKSEVRILVVGLSGHGKSSLINKIVDKKVADVAHGATACRHDGYIKEHELKFNETTLHIYDTQGLGDARVTGEEIFSAIRSELDKVDLLLICHKLFERAEEATEQMFKQLKTQCGKELLNRSVLCYTKADEYITNMGTDFDEMHMIKPRAKSFTKSLKATCTIETSTIAKQNEMIKRRVKSQIESLTAAIKPFLVQTLTKEEFNDVPKCVTSTRRLPSCIEPDWMSTFWGHCTKRCNPEAADFLGWFARNKTKISQGIAVGGTGAVGGAVAGGVVGGLVGTGVMPIPGVGTAVGVVVGATVGGLVAGTVGGTMIVSSVKKAAEEMKRSKHNNNDEENE